MKEIDSKIFGRVTLLTEGDKDLNILQDIVSKHPINAFQILNKYLNTLGYLIRISGWRAK